MPLKPDERGVTLIELLVAVVILAMGTLALWQSLSAAGRGIAGQAPRLFAQEVAMNRAAELRLSRPGDPALPERVRMGGRDWRLHAAPLGAPEAGLQGIEIRVEAEPGPGGARLLVWLEATGAEP